jgi:hypothetical protein
MSNKLVCITCQGKGWKVKTAGAKRAAKITATQAEAIQVGRRIAMHRGTQLIVYRADGTIRSKDSFGKDTVLFIDKSRRTTI